MTRPIKSPKDVATTSNLEDFASLLQAVKEGHTEEVEAYLEVHPNLIAADKSGCTSLSWAVSSEHKSIVELLLRHPNRDSTLSIWGRQSLDSPNEAGHTYSIAFGTVAWTK